MLKLRLILVCLTLFMALIASCRPQVVLDPEPLPSATPVSPETSTPENTPTTIPLPTGTTPPIPSQIPATPPDEVLQWLGTHAIAFDTAEPGTGCTDLNPLIEMIGEAQVVALGEATHGTHEFFTMKQRIIECLVQEKGFNLVALEAGWAETAHINHEVVLGSDAPIEARNRYPYFGGTSELWDLIAWMQAYNEQAEPANQVRLLGFDMQYGDLLVEDIIAYIREIDPDSLVVLQDSLRCFQTHVINFSANPGADRYSQAGAEIQVACQQGLRAVYDMFLSNQAAYETASSPVDFAETIAEVLMLIQNEQLMAESDMLSSINLRDRFMAENVSWLLEQAGPDTKIVIWAHNGHVTDAQSTWTETEAAMLGGSPGLEMIPMGAHLRATHGDSLVVVGFAFYRGSFLAFGISDRTNVTQGYGVYNLVGPLEASHEEYLAKVPLPRYILDLRMVKDTPTVADWFSQARLMTSFGLGYVVDDPQANADKIVLPEAFDILIYFSTTTAAER